MSAGFTPGPWSIDPRHGGDKEIIVRQDGDSWHRLQAAVDCDDCDLKMAIANAHLIAAAPELYDALEVICGGSEDVSNTAIIVGYEATTVLEQARAALARARGEQVPA